MRKRGGGAGEEGKMGGWTTPYGMGCQPFFSIGGRGEREKSRKGGNLNFRFFFLRSGGCFESSVRKGQALKRDGGKRGGGGEQEKVCFVSMGVSQKGTKKGVEGED